jgi:hypothetical protein
MYIRMIFTETQIQGAMDIMTRGIIPAAKIEKQHREFFRQFTATSNGDPQILAFNNLKSLITQALKNRGRFSRKISESLAKQIAKTNENTPEHCVQEIMDCATEILAIEPIEYLENSNFAKLIKKIIDTTQQIQGEMSASTARNTYIESLRAVLSELSTLPMRYTNGSAGHPQNNTSPLLMKINRRLEAIEQFPCLDKEPTILQEKYDRRLAILAVIDENRNYLGLTSEKESYDYTVSRGEPVLREYLERHPDIIDILLNDASTLESIEAVMERMKLALPVSQPKIALPVFQIQNASSDEITTPQPLKPARTPSLTSTQFTPVPGPVVSSALISPPESPHHPNCETPSPTHYGWTILSPKPVLTPPMSPENRLLKGSRSAAPLSTDQPTELLRPTQGL